MHTRPLAELRSADEALFGGKSASLGELIAAGSRCRRASRSASSGLRGDRPRRRDRRPGRGSTRGPRRGASAAAAIGERCGRAGARRRPRGGRGALRRADRAAARRSRCAPARSARTAPRRPSPASRRPTCGCAAPTRVCDAVRDCWASLYNPEAISYRARLGVPARAPAMGVTVQLMVDAEVSGVMFTCNPVSGDPSSVAINASWGLGLAVVGGEVTPDEYRVSKVTGEVLQRTVGAEGRSSTCPIRPAAGPMRAEVAPERQGVACLDDEQLAALLEVGRRVERHFGGHQDVEWAIDRDGRAATCSSRGPVTTAARASPTRRPAEVGDASRAGHVRRAARRPDGADRRRRPRDPAADRRVGARRAAHRDGRVQAARGPRRRGDRAGRGEPRGRGRRPTAPPRRSPRRCPARSTARRARAWTRSWRSARASSRTPWSA